MQHAPWAEAVDAIARQPAYGGLELRPQLGLVPLGLDPHSGLWEFGHFGASGHIAKRDQETGKLRVDAETGLVFVLLPGGEFLFGAQSEDPEGPQYDASARPHEGPLEHVVLAPFFLSKFEMTQAQWTRVAGTNPSYWADGDSFGGRSIARLEAAGEYIDETGFDFEFASSAYPRTRISYDTDNDGRIDLVFSDEDHDEIPETQLTLIDDVWEIGPIDAEAVNPEHFEDSKLRKRFKVLAP